MENLLRWSQSKAAPLSWVPMKREKESVRLIPSQSRPFSSAKPVYIINDGGVSVDWNKNGYRLPTEAEWEFAAKGGNKSGGFQYAGSDSIDEVAWHKENSRFKTHPVKEKKPNELGLFDMSGNVYEWCWDWFGESYFADSPDEDPKGPETGERKILRGGCWYSEAKHSVIGARVHADPNGQGANVGFRLCRNLP